MAGTIEGQGLIARVTAALRYAVSGNAPADWFGPGQALPPQAPDSVRGRAFDYGTAANINFRPRAGEPLGFERLKLLAKHPVVAMLIQRQKDKVTAVDWQVKVRHEAHNTGEPDAGTKAIIEFLRYPDKEHDWCQWISAVLDQLMTIDAVTVYAAPTRSGAPYALQVLDGAMIKPVLDLGGRRPLSPQPAYQQIIKGLPAIDYTADELIYFPQVYRADKSYGYCYDSETEIMTRSRGWTKFGDLHPSEEVATRSKDGEFEWQVPSRIIQHDWNGPMYQFRSRSMDLMVTPEHRMLVTTLPSKLGSRAGKSEVIITAAQLAEHNHHEIKIPVTSFWEGEEVGEQVFAAAENDALIDVVRVSNGRTQTYSRRCAPPPPVSMSGDDFCALMGAYIAEGNKRHQGGIEVAQRPFSKGYALYKPLFDRIGGSYNGRAFILSRRALNDYFEQFGLAHDKFVPDCIRNAQPRQIQIFLDFYLAGDGYFADAPNVSGRGDHPAKIASATTVSRKLADHLTELAQKVGASASVTVRKASRQAFFGGRYYSDCREAYLVRFRYSKAMSVNADLTHYEGPIHCVEVGNGIVYVRRNGKPAWCGNSRVEQAADLIDAAISRLKSQNGYFNFGNLGDGYFTAPESWTPDQVKDLQNQWNAMMQGVDPAQRRSSPFLPMGTEWHATKADVLTDAYDEFLIRLLCFPFGVAPTPFMKQAGLGKGSAGTEHDAAEEGGIAPLMQYIERLMGLILAKWFDRPDLEFSFIEDREFDPNTKSEIEDRRLKNGSLSLNEVRNRNGEPPVADGDKPMIYLTGGPVLLEDAVKPRPDPVLPVPGAGLAQPAGAEGTVPAGQAEPSVAPKAPLAKADIAAQARLKAVLAAYLAAKANEAATALADTLTKADKPYDPTPDINDALDGLDFTWSDLPELIRPILAGIAVTAGTKAASELGLFDADTLTRIAARAVAWADARAAELVGMKRINGELVANPDADLAISETTRDMLRTLITNSLSEGTSNADLRGEILDSIAFSESRAEMIARTETAMADVQGMIAGWKESGVVAGKEWLTDSNPCPICEALDGEVVGLDEEFEGGDPPLHPSCECTVIAVLNEEMPATASADSVE